MEELNQKTVLTEGETYQMQVPTLPKSGGHLSLTSCGSRPLYINRVDGEWVTTTRFNNTARANVEQKCLIHNI